MCAVNRVDFVLFVLFLKVPNFTPFTLQVPKGTNGGMSVLGTTMSLMGGLFIGLVAWISILGMG